MKKNVVVTGVTRGIGRQIALDLADGPRGQFLDGTWHARAALMANADKVAKVASELPYLKF